MAYLSLMLFVQRCEELVESVFIAYCDVAGGPRSDGSGFASHRIPFLYMTIDDLSP